MTRLKLRYIKAYTDRIGKTRRYFNKTGFAKTPLPGLPGSIAFMEVYQRCLAEVEATKRSTASVSEAVKPGSFADLVQRYYGSSSFKTLRPITKSTYRNVINHLVKENGDKPVDRLDRKGIMKLVDQKSETPGTANKVLRTLRMLMRFAIKQEMRTDDPTAGLAKLRVSKEGFLAWDEDHIRLFEGHHPIGSRARLAFALLIFTAQRRSDVIRLGPQHIRNGRLSLRQQKTGTFLDIPVHPELAMIIDRSAVSDMTFLRTEQGKSFAPAGFGNWFGDCCRQAGLPLGFNAHGLRKAAARRLAEAGATTQEIMAITGHQSISEVERYTRAANQRHLASKGMSRLTELSNDPKVSVLTR
ncbi:integrase [Rhodoligotrophos appendicifer]|uniref:tyrosine-type recombinase/integrase n=1 Tax=Rhodoligotrophos appendicifer TaxID=987056 RepID=UPI001186FAFC|nr:tyrosine-type recombinase/integrase [Rhodoligotrophos appendicifer]